MDNRAKQFVPFAAVKGYEEALREKEKIAEEEIKLSENVTIWNANESLTIFDENY